MRCPNYTGVTCVDGSCPNILADHYPEYGYELYGMADEQGKKIRVCKDI